MTDEEKYLFDLQGYVVLESVVPQELVDGCNEALDRYENMAPADYPPPLALGDQRTESNLYISNIMNTSNRPRRTLYYCYSIGYMPDWGGQSLRFSEVLPQRLSEEQREVIRLK